MTANNMYSLLRTPHPPTGVEHAVEAHFFGPWERNLLVAGANMLRVFRMVPDLSQNTDTTKEETSTRLYRGLLHGLLAARTDIFRAPSGGACKS